MAQFDGTTGNDFLVGTAENDEFFFSEGNDTLVGGEGEDDFAIGSLPDDVVIDLVLGTITAPGLTQSISEIENLEVYDAKNGILRGDEKDNYLFLLGGRGSLGVLEGRGGDDYLNLEDSDGSISGGDGDDTLSVFGSSPNVTVEGGNGVDELLLQYNSDDIKVTTNAEGQRVLSYDDDYSVTLLDEVENFVFPDGVTLTYDEITPLPPITGTEGDDTIMGTDGDDQILGLGGDDWITPGLGEDTVDGGAGVDMISYVDQRGLIVDLSLERAFTGRGEYQPLINIENITGTSIGDRLTGDDGANVLRGLGGSDRFFATGGGDLLVGGAGTDRVYASDLIEGADTSVSLLRGRIWEGEGAGSRLRSIEQVVSGAGDDQLTGDHSVNRLHAGNGDDTLMGNGGDDLIYGGFGDDVALYSKAQDQYEVTQNGEVTQVSYIGDGVGDGTDLLLSIETLRFADGDLML